MRFLELKIPPPVVGLLTAIAMWVVAGDDIPADSIGSLRPLAAVVLAATGAAFDIAALLAFRRAKTTVNPMRPGSTSSIVQSGVYRVTRNPMYVGLALFLCGWAAYLWSLPAMLGPVAFVAYMTRFQILPEERVLAKSFGAEYLAYMKKVRRWL